MHIQVYGSVRLLQLLAKQCSLKQNFLISLNHSHTRTQTEAQRQYAGWLVTTSVRGECYIRLINTA